MRITVRNLGVLKEANIDLKPLTVFIGPNNSGKTWLAYALASIFGPYGLGQYIQAYIEKGVHLIYEELNQAVEQVIAKGNATIDLQELANDYGEKYFNELAKLAQTWMDTFLGTQLARFDDLDISLDLAETKTQFLNQISRYSLRRDIGPQGSLLTIRKPRDDNHVFAYTSAEIQNAEEPGKQLEREIPHEEIKERLISFVLTALQHSLYPRVPIFPTERTFLVTGSFNTKASRLPIPTITEKVREALEILVQEIENTSESIGQNNFSRANILPPPVSSFAGMLDSAFDYGAEERKARGRSARNNIKIKKYVDFAEVLEKQILGGSINFSTPEPDSRRKILFQPSQAVSLELSTASSMAKELSSLVLYLRLFARPGELLIIDEPEMNLHPEAQAKMIEFLAMLVNAGLNVLFTTHSPYITDHLTNLIKANESEDKEAIKDNFFLKRTDAFIAREKVAVYGFGEGTAKDVLDEEGFIDLNTFGEVSERTSNIYSTL